MSGTTLTYTDADFRAQCPYFASVAAYPQTTLQMYFDLGTNFISATNYGNLNGAGRQAALYWMTAHLAKLGADLAIDPTSQPGFVTDATVDKVRIAVEPPPGKSQFSWWLNQTTYGQQLLALLAVVSAGGLYLAGRPQLGAFRNTCGGFV